jgi:antirestriction protein ArdC/predicted nucleotidyltransferase
MADSKRVREQLKEITDRLEQGIMEVFESEKYKEYLNTMSKFYNYSFNNTMLIAMQKPDATLIAGYKAWPNKFERHVRRGEKGIRIIAPAPVTVKEELEKLDPVTQEPMLDEHGNPVMEEVEIRMPNFKVISVFDVSQTEGKELPDLVVDELTGDVEQYDSFMQALTEVSPVPIGYEEIPDGAKGYYHLEERRIALQEGMSQIQNSKTAIHEIAHATLHDIDLNNPTLDMEGRKDRKTKEVEAESIAYAVCQHYGIDTSEYSFGYVAGWSSDKELKELKSSLETIRKTSATLINTIDERMAELQLAKEQEVEQGLEQSNPIESTQERQEQIPQSSEDILLHGEQNSFGIYQLKEGEELHYHRFEGLERLKNHGLQVEKKNYELIYTAPLQDAQTLDDIFEQFNLFRPEDFTGHSLSVSDIVLIHKDGVNTAQYVDSFGFQEISDFLEVQAELEQQTEAAYEFADRYLMIHECEDGYDYTFYDKQYHEMDGGVYDNPDISLEEAVHIILTDDPFPNMERTPVDYEELDEKVEEANRILPPEEVEKVSMLSDRTEPMQDLNGMSPAEIEETVLAYAQTKAEEYGNEVHVLAARVYGSRTAGIERENSDVDIVIEYKGELREDDFFAMLHEDGLSIGGMPVDINPITAEKSGTIEEYLARANEYLEEKVKGAREVTSDQEKVEVITEKPEQYLTFYVAECMEITMLGEYHENLTMEQAVEIYHNIPAERMHGGKGIGFVLHNANEPGDAFQDMEYDLYSAGSIDVDTINHIQEFRDSPLVQQAIEDMKVHFPAAEVWDRETKAEEARQSAEQFATDCEQYAIELDQFAEDYDTHEYRDSIEDKEENVQAISASVQQGDTAHLKEWLQSIIEEEEPIEDVKRAGELLKQLDDLAVKREKNPLTKVEEQEEANYDQIDGTLNNIEPKENLSIMEKLEQGKKRITKEDSAVKVPKKTEKKTEKYPERGMD